MQLRSAAGHILDITLLLDLEVLVFLVHQAVRGSALELLVSRKKIFVESMRLSEPDPGLPGVTDDGSGHVDEGLPERLRGDPCGLGGTAYRSALLGRVACLKSFSPARFGH